MILDQERVILIILSGQFHLYNMYLEKGSFMSCTQSIIDGIEIEFVKQFYFFGLIIDEDLNWNKLRQVLFLRYPEP